MNENLYFDLLFQFGFIQLSFVFIRNVELNQFNVISIKYFHKGHGGHDEPDNESLPIPPMKNNKHLYDINGQINHKVLYEILNIDRLWWTFVPVVPLVRGVQSTEEYLKASLATRTIAIARDW